MAYSAEISRKQPALLVLLIDQSNSMEEPWAGTGASKAQALAEAVNMTLNNAIGLCSTGSPKIRNYFELCVLGYGADVSFQLPGSDSSRPAITIGDLERAPKRIETRVVPAVNHSGQRVDLEKPFPVWVDPAAGGMTPMTMAFRTAEPIVRRWCAEHPSSFPPLVVNITDGESTDGDPTIAAQAVGAVGTDDGASLIFNVHLSGRAEQPFTYPSSRVGLPDHNADMLFGMSSQLPPTMYEAARQQGKPLAPGARGFLYNADSRSVFEFLNLGTRAVTPTGLKELTSGALAIES
ncbi:VWA domain-containing protein [Nocardia huaxiensis]|uniref:VWA domain-containing protein n=1 Tax=Nocardia huaxiensis TaxID=2755382 RepID=A0A7D6VE83_9NOCA|nr:VWA domain-containing protein [Nocardia huaxiensis]QLY30415.1 VWA domain-containing protein [Nocardia huaxiensis]